MFDIRLQLGCLIVTLYFIVEYVKNSWGKKIKCNRYFDVLIAVVPWAIVLDGVTAWSVNNRDVVPDWLNITLHCLFFIALDIVVILIFVYMVNQTVGIVNRKQLLLLLTPGIINIIGILVFIGQLRFEHGESTDYSMGISVIVGYSSLVIHYVLIFLLLILKRKTVEKAKFFGVFTFMLMSVALLAVQVIFPQMLMTAVHPMLIMIGIYINFEDPSIRKLERYNADMVTGFATLVENRDNSTGGHIRRTKGYVQIILDQMKKYPRYDIFLSKDYIKYVLDAAPMHDIGKIATPDYILQKPGKLTNEEYEIMKQHAPIGGDIINEIFEELGEPEYQKIAYEVARFHHEKWNGKGYPDGLSGTDIPLHARIMAIADVFDAVSAKRCYRDAMPIEKCFMIIEEGSGKDFDPELVAMFLSAKDKVLKFYNKEK